MLAAVFKRTGVLEIEDRPQPQGLAGDEVLLEVEGCGVCGSDLHILSEPPGHPATEGVILGHEIVARIVDKGAAVREFETGTRIIVDPNLKCGLCSFCRKGQPNQCKNGTTIGIFLDGGFARFVKAPQKALHPIRADVPLKEAVWGELLSCVLGSTERVRIQPGQVAVVIGAGPAGMLHAMLFDAAGAEVILVDVANGRLNFGRSAGITKTLNPKETDLEKYISDVTSGEYADAVVDAVGNQFAACLGIVARGGVISLFGVNSHALPLIPQYDITRKEVTIVGSFVGRNMFPRSIAVLESGILDLSGLISHDVGITNLPQAIQEAREGRAMKILVRPEE
ncbi:MAG TPA: alcohol dehydrogenase catalytic domain-containing protein [Chthoniobacterales bacterium]